jgi:hypothetical protein
MARGRDFLPLASSHHVSCASTLAGQVKHHEWAYLCGTIFQGEGASRPRYAVHIPGNLDYGDVLGESEMRRGVKEDAGTILDQVVFQVGQDNVALRAQNWRAASRYARQAK